MKNLRKLKATEVSLVPQAANGKTFAILKAAPDPEPVVQPAAKPGWLDGVKKIVKSFGKKDDKPDAEEAIGDGLSREAQTALNATALILAPHKDEITDDHLDAIQNEIGIEGGGDGDVKPEHMKEAMGEATKAFKAHMEKMGYQKYPMGELTMKGKTNNAVDGGGEGDDDDEEDNVRKEKVLKEDGTINLDAVPEDMRAVMEVVQKQMGESKASIEAANKRATDAEAKLVAVEKSRAEDRAAARKTEIAVIAKEFKHQDTELVQTALELADGAGKEKFESVLKKFQAQEVILKDNAFTTLGSDAPSINGAAGNDSDIMVKVSKAVEGIVQKSAAAGVKITKEQAEADFLISPAGKELYAQHKAQRQVTRHDGA